MSADLAGLYTIPAGVGFLDSLARGLLDRWGEAPSGLSQVRMFLPTRRACQAMADAFLRVTDGRPLLLPRLEPLGDLDPEDWHAAASSASAAIANLPPAIAPARRQLLLARLILSRDRAIGPDQALKLADALGRWLDQVQIYDLDPDNLAALVPDEYAAHWAETLKFLSLVTQHWPAIVAEEGAMDAVERHKAVIAAQIDAWAADPPRTPVIAAGSTGSLPSTAAIMRAILDLPAGAVVLPGLDTALDEAAWQALPEGHPQFGLAKLLVSLDRPRAEVQFWAATLRDDPHLDRVQAGRSALLRQALRPADAPPPDEPAGAAKEGLTHLTAVVAAGPEAEARVIALAFRDFLERTDDEAAALVTADRGLAQRVAAELSRWGIAIDDSAGTALPETRPGIYLRLVAQAACGGLAPVPLLALLKHPLTAVDPADVLRLERAALRGLRPAPGLKGLRAALEPADCEALEPLLVRIEAGEAPLLALTEAGEAPLADWLTAHVEAAEALAETADETGPDRLWQDEAGEAAALALDSLLAAATGFPSVSADDYPAVLDGLLDRQTVRPRYGKHPRLAILGPLEARLQCPQLAILGSLNEGSWPPEPERDPWMGRPMRLDFGLPLPEWRIGLAAHDFAQALAAPEVMLTRAARVGGAPTVPSRWLARLELAARAATGTLAADSPDPLREGAGYWLGLAEALDQPSAPAISQAPKALPPVAARFRDLSVTDAERWLRDPYGHYARHILRLRALDAVDEPPDAGDRGEVLHAALRQFVNSLGSGEWPDNAMDRLTAAGRQAFGPLLERPGVRAFWWRRFERMAGWFTAHEATRWPDVVEARTEHKLAGDIVAADQTVTLSARLDRLDRIADAGFTVIDYKSGALPSANETAGAWSPQLPLEGMLVLLCHPGATLDGLEAWAVGGGSSKDEGGSIRDMIGQKRDPVEVAEAAWDGLSRLLVQFSDPAMPYLAEPRPPLAPRFSDYRHLARIDREGGGDA